MSVPAKQLVSTPHAVSVTLCLFLPSLFYRYTAFSSTLIWLHCGRNLKVHSASGLIRPLALSALLALSGSEWSPVVMLCSPYSWTLCKMHCKLHVRLLIHYVKVEVADILNVYRCPQALPFICYTKTVSCWSAVSQSDQEEAK